MKSQSVRGILFFIQLNGLDLDFGSQHKGDEKYGSVHQKF